VTEVENAVYKKITEYVKTLSTCNPTSSEKKNESEINSLKINLAKIDTEINNIINNLSSANEIMMKYANAKIVELDTQKSDILNRLNELTIKKEHKLVIPDMSNWETKDNTYRKKIANILIKKIYVYNENVEIAFKY
jgi:sugar lactone lactonase YvrE